VTAPHPEIEGWSAGLSRAYSLGLDHGLRTKKHPSKPPGSFLAVDLAGGFDASYYHGFGHGAGVCCCAETLAGKRRGQVCVVCGHRRTP
jgi:hypothetical protein